MGRAQIAMEYILIFALVFVITIPALVAFRNYSVESNDKIIDQRIQKLSNTIIDAAREIYYYGPPSKTVVRVDMPPQIEAMAVSAIKQSDNSYEYYLMYRIAYADNPDGKGTLLLVDSDIPIVATDSDSSSSMITSDSDCNGLSGRLNHPQCFQNGPCVCLPKSDHSEGPKQFLLKVIEGTGDPVTSECKTDARYCVSIDEYSNNLS